uniref:Uncharacterized protein n=1 Tax=Anguilla anguilla TaxID=7936 RepID=A0A0E9PPF7_ANGAN
MVPIFKQRLSVTFINI